MKTAPEFPSRPPIRFGHRLVCFFLFSAVGLAIQWLPVELFLGVEIILGGFAPLVLGLILGPAWGGAAAVLVYSATWYRWGHLYAMLLAVGEVLWVGYFARRQPERALRSDVVYWLVLGIPAGYLCYSTTLGIQPLTSLLAILKQATNGALNMFVALLCLVLLPQKFVRFDSALPNRRQVPLGLLLDMTLVGFCLVPAVVLLVLGGKADVSFLNQNATDELKVAVQGANRRIGEWFLYRKSAVETLALLSSDDLNSTHDLRQQHVAAVARSNREFHNMSIVNADGVTVAFEPPVNEFGQSTIGLDFSDREYYKRVKTERKTVVSDVFPGRGGVFEPIVTISAPIPSNGGFMGFALGAVNLGAISRILLGVSRDYGPDILLVDSKNLVIATTNKHVDVMGTPDPVPETHRLPLTDNAFIYLPRGTQDRSIENWMDADFVFTDELHEIAGWKLTAQIPVARYEGPLVRGYMFRFVIVLVALMLALSVAALLQRILARPLTRLAFTTQDFPESGRIPKEADWPRSSIEEIERLTTNFTAMTHVLSEYVSTLKIRTDELALANEDLRTQMHERRRLERHVHQAQKMQAIGTLAGGIAHDFNNMLVAIMGYANLVQLDLPEGHPGHMKLAELLKASQRARDLVKQILMFSRRNEQEQRPVDLTRIILDALALIRPSLPSTVAIVDELPKEPCAIIGDPTQLNQLIVNLCANAEHAMRPRGGTLSVKMSRVSLKERLSGAQPPVGPGDYYVIRIVDTGHGMSKDTQDRIFEPFFTTKGVGEGTGLGLSLVHGVVSSHSGGIVVKSVVGDGTTFDVYLPAVHGDVLTPVTPSQEVPRGGERLYFVDDEPSIADVGAEMLRTVGYDVVSFTDAEAALTAFREEAHLVAVVVTDQTMPKMTGDMLISKMREIRPDLPAIVCSGYSHVMTPEKARALGIDDFIFKPFDLKILARAVRAVLDRRASAVQVPKSF
ncbi:MAG: response regulator [Myxococcales bacterium]|nr:response regulator [Myxococcales bacterium]